MSFIRNVIKVVISNFSTILAGVMVSFLLPKIISVNDYGFYKIFSLYFNYLGVLSLGIIDGIVLKYGNKDYDELEKEKLRTIFRIYLFIHLIFSLITIFISLVFLKADYMFIFLMLAAVLIPTNTTGYFEQISQITQRFKIYSLRKIIQSLCNITLIVLMTLLFYNRVLTFDYKFYVVGTVVIGALLASWYLVTYRAIVFGKSIPIKECLPEIGHLIKIGFPLLVANLCSTLLLSLDRQFVSILFSTEQYATYAFAYSMLSLITVATSSISTVIYPLFKRLDKEKLISNYNIVSAIILAFVFCIVLVYNPLCYFIEWFLPHYIESITIFRIILPGVSLSAAITVVLHNYYKVLGYSFKYFILSLFALLISFSFNIAAYLIFETREAISIASIVSLAVWYLSICFFIRKECPFSIKNFIYIVLMFSSFYLSTIISIHWLSLLIQLAAFSLITFIFLFKDFAKIKQLLSKSSKKTISTTNDSK